jgi:hypothetical protein
VYAFVSAPSPEAAASAALASAAPGSTAEVGHEVKGLWVVLVHPPWSGF